MLAAGSPGYYAAFFCPARNFAQRARWKVAIFLREAADMVRFAGAVATVFPVPAAGFDSFLILSHLACCASAILCREAAEIFRVGWFVFWDVPEPFSDSIAEIA